MRTEYFITMDAHSRTTDLCVKTRLGKPVQRVQLRTTIPVLAEFIESVPRPRYLSFEESSIAGWLYRNLHERVDQTVVCDPRRNAYVAKDAVSRGCPRAAGSSAKEESSNCVSIPWRRWT